MSCGAGPEGWYSQLGSSVCKDFHPAGFSEVWEFYITGSSEEAAQMSSPESLPRPSQPRQAAIERNLWEKEICSSQMDPIN